MVFQRTSWLQISLQGACSQLILWWRLFWGLGLLEHLKHEGTSHSSSDLLKICMNMGASWSAQTFRQEGDTATGPDAFPLSSVESRSVRSGRNHSQCTARIQLNPTHWSFNWWSLKCEPFNMDTHPYSEFGSKQLSLHHAEWRVCLLSRSLSFCVAVPPAQIKW